MGSLPDVVASACAGRNGGTVTQLIHSPLAVNYLPLLAPVLKTDPVSR